MNKYTHAWLGLMALKRMDSLKNNLDPAYRGHAGALLRFLGKYKDTFVQGAWFPDKPIEDNILGGHTWKYRPLKGDKERPQTARKVTYRPPSHLSCQKLVRSSRFKEKVVLNTRSHLPDRCEAVSQTIRDMVKIRNKEDKGSPIMYNDSQIALSLMILGHYVADGHVPPHCDDRDFYDPSTIHPDMEKFWEKEIRFHYQLARNRKRFVLDEKGFPARRMKNKKKYAGSILEKTEEILKERKWHFKKDRKGKIFYLGKGNKNLWDYMVAICFTSYLVSTDFIPLSVPKKGSARKKGYEKLKILKEPCYRQRFLRLSPHILADTIDSIALLWLFTWDRYTLLEETVRSKKGEKT